MGKRLLLAAALAIAVDVGGLHAILVRASRPLPTAVSAAVLCAVLSASRGRFAPAPTGYAGPAGLLESACRQSLVSTSGSLTAAADSLMTFLAVVSIVPAAQFRVT